MADFEMGEGREGRRFCKILKENFKEREHMKQFLLHGSYVQMDLKNVDLIVWIVLSWLMVG
jgi:hypothetical protein